jgi:hypothetical protein
MTAVDGSGAQAIDDLVPAAARYQGMTCERCAAQVQA